LEDVNVALSIRLKRVGSSKKPVFRLVAVDLRRGSEKGRVETLGTIDPRATEIAVPNFKKEKVQEWIRRGAVVSPSAKQLLKKLGVEGPVAPVVPAENKN
jgi:small subunit ribosomal protein S16